MYTDYNPLQHIFGQTADISRTTANRVQRRAVSLFVYNYDSQYCPSYLNSSADALACLLLEKTTDTSEKADIQLMRLAIFEDFQLNAKSFTSTYTQ